MQGKNIIHVPYSLIMNSPQPLIPRTSSTSSLTCPTHSCLPSPNPRKMWISSVCLSDTLWCYAASDVCPSSPVDCRDLKRQGCGALSWAYYPLILSKCMHTASTLYLGLKAEHEVLCSIICQVLWGFTVGKGGKNKYMERTVQRNWSYDNTLEFYVFRPNLK